MNAPPLTMLGAAQRMCSRHSHMAVEVPCAPCRERARQYLRAYADRYPWLDELRRQLGLPK